MPQIAALPDTTYRTGRDPSPGLRDASTSVPELSSEALLAGRREIVIRHGGQIYRLRHTRNDKLILTK